MDFENFYITWYSRVKHFARDYVLSEEEAENITQDVFLDFYQKRESLDFHINVIAYLFTSVKIGALITCGVNYWSRKQLRGCRRILTCLFA